METQRHVDNKGIPEQDWDQNIGMRNANAVVNISQDVV